VRAELSSDRSSARNGPLHGRIGSCMRHTLMIRKGRQNLGSRTRCTPLSLPTPCRTTYVFPSAAGTSTHRSAPETHRGNAISACVLRNLYSARGAASSSPSVILQPSRFSLRHPCSLPRAVFGPHPWSPTIRRYHRRCGQRSLGRRQLRRRNRRVVVVEIEVAAATGMNWTGLISVRCTVSRTMP
jgi:hypothetical protein